MLYRCGHCEDLFDENQDLLKHSESAHQKQTTKSKKGRSEMKKYPGFCDLCGCNSKYIEWHMYYNHNTDPTNCDKCGKVFGNKEKLNTHYQTVHEKTTCFICGKDIPVKKHSYHMLSIHTKSEDRPHKCTTCGKGFIFPDKLEEHYNVHTGAKPFKCKYCPKSYGSVGTRNMHQKSHLGIKRNYVKKRQNLKT